MLLIALAVLTLLSIIAVTFVALMRLELKATENFRDKSRAQLLSKSAESAVLFFCELLLSELEISFLKFKKKQN